MSRASRNLDVFHREAVETLRGRHCGVMTCYRLERNRRTTRDLSVGPRRRRGPVFETRRGAALPSAVVARIEIPTRVTSSRFTRDYIGVIKKKRRYRVPCREDSGRPRPVRRGTFTDPLLRRRASRVRVYPRPSRPSAWFFFPVQTRFAYISRRRRHP